MISEDRVDRVMSVLALILALAFIFYVGGHVVWSIVR